MTACYWWAFWGIVGGIAGGVLGGLFVIGVGFFLWAGCPRKDDVV